MNNTKKIGELGERIARSYLKKKGYRILDTNFYFRPSQSPLKGEIDIVAQKDDVVSFMEVKALSRPKGSVRPEEKVNSAKIKKIEKSAEYWLAKNNIPLDSKWEIGVIAINIDLEKKKARVRHLTV